MNDHTLSIVLIACAILLVLAGPGLSQGNPAADFSIELLEGIPPRTPPGSKGTFKFAVTNHGSDAGAPPILFSAIASPVPFVSGQGDALGFFRSDFSGNDCYIRWGIPTPAPGAPLFILYSTYVDTLAPGETFVCEVEYWVNANFDFAADERIVNGQLPVEWHVATFNSDDPDPNNDTIHLTFVFLAPTIPTLSPVGMALMVVALCTSAVVLRGRWPPAGSPPQSRFWRAPSAGAQPGPRRSG